MNLRNVLFWVCKSLLSDKKFSPDRTRRRIRWDERIDEASWWGACEADERYDGSERDHYFCYFFYQLNNVISNELHEFPPHLLSCCILNFAGYVWQINPASSTEYRSASYHMLTVKHQSSGQELIKWYKFYRSNYRKDKFRSTLSTRWNLDQPDSHSTKYQKRTIAHYPRGAHS